MLWYFMARSVENIYYKRFWWVRGPDLYILPSHHTVSMNLSSTLAILTCKYLDVRLHERDLDSPNDVYIAGCCFE